MTNIEKNFFGLNIAPAILDVLGKLNFKTPTPIQEQSIPIGLEGKDLIGVAQTGTGKTLAFGVPLIQRALQNKGLGLVIVPTRELAIQVEEALQKVGRHLGIKTATLIGGEPIHRQIRALRLTPHIVIGTPGRLIDHLEQRTLNLSKVATLVLDEADRMLDMGFAPQLKRIQAVLPQEKQVMLFSATMPEAIVSMARMFMKLPVRVEIAQQGSTAKDVTQELFFVAQESKPRLLEKILTDYKGSVILFSRTKHGVKKIVTKIRSMRETVGEIHSDRSLGQRKEAMFGFKTGKYRVLVATDIAARGIDVSNIELVINYDLPDNAEDYVHRIGRTGRAGGKGHAISFARPNQRGDVKSIERLIRLTLPVSKLPELPGIQANESSETAAPYKPSYSSRPGGYSSRPSYSGKSNYSSRPSGASSSTYQKATGYKSTSLPGASAPPRNSSGPNYSSRPSFSSRSSAPSGSGYSARSAYGSRPSYSSRPSSSAGSSKSGGFTPQRRFGSSFGSNKPKFGGGSTFKKPWHKAK